jgi:hypothetical protein
MKYLLSREPVMLLYAKEAAKVWIKKQPPQRLLQSNIKEILNQTSSPEDKFMFLAGTMVETACL